MEVEEVQSLPDVPEIAHCCCLFSDTLGLPDLEIEELEESLCSKDGRGADLLLDVLCKLLNGCYNRKDIGLENYDRFLNDIFKYRLKKEQGEENPLKNSSFLQLSSRQKIEVLIRLLHFRMDACDVQERLKGLKGDSMRVVPIGMDAQGAKYWYFYGSRLYKEDPQSPVWETAPPKNKRGRKRKKSAKNGNGRDFDKADRSDEESLRHLKDQEDEQLETSAVKRTARVRVCLEKKDDDNDEDMSDNNDTLNIYNDADSFKFDYSSEEDEDEPFVDHSSDEDYSEKGTKKRARGRRKKTGANSTSRLAKKAKVQLPQILRATPKSARLRAKYGISDENGKDSHFTPKRNGRMESDQSLGKSRRIRKNGKKAQKKQDGEISEKPSHMDGELSTERKSPEHVNMENELVQPEIKNVRETEESSDVETQQSSGTSDVEIEVDIAPKENDQTAESIETAEIAKKGCLEDGQQIKRNAESLDVVKAKVRESGDAKEEMPPFRCFTKQAVTGDNPVSSIEHDIKVDKSDEGYNEMKSTVRETNISIKQESQDSAPADQSSSRSLGVLEIKEEQVNSVQSTNNFLTESAGPNMCPQKVEREATDTSDSQEFKMPFGISKERKACKPWEPRPVTLASQKTGWHLVCEVMEDWQYLVDCLKDSTNRDQLALVKVLLDDFLPQIPSIQEAKEIELKRRKMETAPRRLSTRLLYKKKDQEERERILREAQEEEDQLRAEEEEERKRRQLEEKLEEQRRREEERERAREGRAKRARLREERAKFLAEGKEIPPELMNGINSDSPVPEEQMLDEEVVAKLHKVLGMCFKCKDAWPFEDPVREEDVPGYHDVIKTPMSLNEMEDKLKSGQYSSKDEFAADMDLIVDNCETFNGDRHDFFHMANILRKKFQQAMCRFFPVRRAKKDDDDFVVEGREVPSGGRRYKAKREASKKALKSFSQMLSDADDTESGQNDHIVVRKSTVSGPLRNPSRSFNGYVGRGSSVTTSISRPDTKAVSVMSSSGHTSVPQHTQVFFNRDAQSIEVRTIRTPQTSHPVALIHKQGTGTPVRLVAASAATTSAGDGASPMVSLLKNKVVKEGNRINITVGRPQGPSSSSSATITSNSGMTSTDNNVQMRKIIIKDASLTGPGKSVPQGNPLSTAPAVAGNIRLSSASGVVNMITREDFLKLLTQNKIRIVQNCTGSKPVTNLQLPGHSAPHVVTVPAQGSGATVMPSVTTPPTNVSLGTTLATPGSAGTGFRYVCFVPASSQGPVVIPAATLQSSSSNQPVTKTDIVLNPWSTDISQSSPLPTAVGRTSLTQSLVSHTHTSSLSGQASAVMSSSAPDIISGSVAPVVTSPSVCVHTQKSVSGMTPKNPANRSQIIIVKGHSSMPKGQATSLLPKGPVRFSSSVPTVCSAPSVSQTVTVPVSVTGSITTPICSLASSTSIPSQAHVSTISNIPANTHQTAPIARVDSLPGSAFSKTGSSVTASAVNSVMKSPETKIQIIRPSVESVHQSLMQETVPKSSIASNIRQRTPVTLQQSDISTAPVQAQTMCGSLERNSLPQERVSMTTPAIRTKTAHKRGPLSSMDTGEILSQPTVSVASKPNFVSQAASAGREVSQTCKTPMKDSVCEMAQSPVKESEGDVIQGRSKRNVVSPNYKYLAGYSTKCMSGKYKNNEAKSGATISVSPTDSTDMNSSQSTGIRDQVAKISPLKRIVVDSDSRNEPPIKVARLNTVISDCNKSLNQERKPAGTLMAAVSSCADAVDSDSLHIPCSLVSNQENVHANVNKCHMQKSSTKDEQIEVEGVYTPSQLEMYTPSLSSSPRTHNLYDTLSSAVQAQEVNTLNSVETSPSSRSNTLGSGNLSVVKSPLKHADRIIVKQALAASISNSPEEEK